MFTALKWFYNGCSHYTSGGFKKAESQFNPNDLQVDISHRNYLITGSNSGIGYSAAMEISKRGGRVHLVCRNREKGEKALNEIKLESNNENVFLHICDLSLIRDVKIFSQQWLESGQTADVLIHNAGIMNNEREETSEGIEKTFATNLLAPFLLTKLLLDNQKPEQRPLDMKQRVIIVSSGGMLTQKMSTDFEFKRVVTEGKKWDGMQAYAQTKRASVYLTELFAQKYPTTNFFSMHPGWVNTPQLESAMPTFNRLTKRIQRTPQEGSDTIVWLAISPTVEDNFSALFFQDRHPVDKFISNSNTESPAQDVEKLWSYLNHYYESIPNYYPSSASSASN
ncbi:hypothetical protein CYY_005437 [Polysphondylium violaceum]|uniref:Dehydrogenase/reductase SDR family member 12 n=1 Tax=Polysphondylium violaceum TaxID=133409 RepID=A0A8J4PT34_9MYCE|nr:hypothetical protein CYY_005437 [Polysphondylium violaceum]